MPARCASGWRFTKTGFRAEAGALNALTLGRPITGLPDRPVPVNLFRQPAHKSNHPADIPAIEPKPDPATPRPGSARAKTAAALPIDAQYGLGERLRETDRLGGKGRSCPPKPVGVVGHFDSAHQTTRVHRSSCRCRCHSAGGGAGTTRKNLAHWVSDARLLVLDGVDASR